jgi:predicted transport protein
MLTMKYENYLTQPKQKIKEIQETCHICIADYEQTDDIYFLSTCEHIFHKDCLSEWFNKQKKCPLCKVALKE